MGKKKKNFRVKNPPFPLIDRKEKKKFESKEKNYFFSMRFFESEATRERRVTYTTSRVLEQNGEKERAEKEGKKSQVFSRSTAMLFLPFEHYVIAPPNSRPTRWLSVCARQHTSHVCTYVRAHRTRVLDHPPVHPPLPRLCFSTYHAYRSRVEFKLGVKYARNIYIFIYLYAFITYMNMDRFYLNPFTYFDIYIYIYVYIAKRNTYSIVT